MISCEARSRQSCHNDPVALGYGRGDLRFEVSGAEGRWQFTPAHASSPQDGLPADAWIGFQQPRTGMVSTRDDVRPFSVEEQRRILRVGACLTCHAGDQPPLRRRRVRFPRRPGPPLAGLRPPNLVRAADRTPLIGSRTTRAPATRPA